MSSSLDRTTHERVDAVIIGSSPLMLCKALELAHSGRSVVVIDRSEVSGGAWYSPAMLGFESMEAGVHLLENRARVYAHLESLGVELARPDRRGFGLWRRFRLPLSLARAVSFSGVLLKSVARKDAGKRSTTLPRLVRSVASLRVPFRYPLEGARGMVSALMASLNALGIDPRLSCEIERVDLEPGVPGGRCRTAGGSIDFASLYFSSRAHCPIRLGELSVEFPVESREICSVQVILPEEVVESFSYVEVIADRSVRRVRDVTEFAQPRPKRSERIICIELRESSVERDRPASVLAHRAVEALARLGLVERTPEIRGFSVDRYAYQTIPDHALVALASRHEALEGVKSTDFAEDLVTALA